MNFIHTQRKAKGFSLVEVVLAIGIFALAVVALLGLLGPTLESVRAVREQNKATAIISKVNTFLQTYEPSLGDPTETRSRFNYFYEELVDDGEIILLGWFDEDRPEGHVIDFAVNAIQDDSINHITDGVIFKIILTPSRFYEKYSEYYSGGDIALPKAVENYPEGFLAFSVAVYTGPVPEPESTVDPNIYASSSTNVWTERLVYNAAINR